MDERPINPNWRSFAKTSWAFELGLEEEEVLPKCVGEGAGTFLSERPEWAKAPKGENCTEGSGNNEWLAVVGTQDVCRLVVGNETGEVETTQWRGMKAPRATSIYREQSREPLDMHHFSYSK